jgi:type II secretory pathway component PulF
MPTFAYNALDAQGRATKGSVEAETRAAALDAVAALGLSPLSVESSDAPAAKTESGPSLFRRKVTAAQVETFTRDLSNLLGAGVPLGRALFILRREASGAARDQWTAIHEDVVGGQSLADALARWSDSFPPVYIAMIRAGELGGFLDVVLAQIADFRVRERELKGKVGSALVYPAVLATVAAGVLVVLLTFFIPRFSGMFANFGQALPLLTRVIVAISNGLIAYGIFAALAVVALVYGYTRLMKMEKGRRFMERTYLRIPALGTVLARFALVRFSRMLGTLLSSGVPLVTALRVAREAIGNQTLSDAVSDAIEQVKRGTALSRSLGTCPQLFPSSVVEMIAVAEESGRLDKELLRLAQTYESELDRRLRILVSLAEPLLLFVMASLIGTIVVGMLLPIFSLQDMIQ